MVLVRPLTERSTSLYSWRWPAAKLFPRWTCRQTPPPSIWSTISSPLMTVRMPKPAVAVPPPSTLKFFVSEEQPSQMQRPQQSLPLNKMPILRLKIAVKRQPMCGLLPVLNPRFASHKRNQQRNRFWQNSPADCCLVVFGIWNVAEWFDVMVDFIANLNAKDTHCIFDFLFLPNLENCTSLCLSCLPYFVILVPQSVFLKLSLLLTHDLMNLLCLILPHQPTFWNA